MFKQLLDKYSSLNSSEQKSLFFKQTLEELKQKDSATILKDLKQSQTDVLKIFQNYPQYCAEFVFQRLSIEDCVELMDLKDESQLESQSYGFLRILNHIGRSVDSDDHRQFIEWFSKMYSKYSGIEKVLVYLAQMTQNYQHKLKNQFLPEFLADFIKSSAVVVESYLKLKSQSPKFEPDYIQHGHLFLNSTERWLKNFYLKLLGNITIQIQNHALRLSILNAVGDIVGAVLEVQRQGNIQNQICNQILNSCYVYVRMTWSLDQFNNMYLSLLENRGFNIPQRKIMVPNSYPSNQLTLPKQSYAYLCFKLLKDQIFLFSDQQVANYLVPLINQVSSFDYDFKSEIQRIFVQKTSSNSTDFKTCFEGNFPLSILWFNLWHYHQKRNKDLLKVVNQIFEKIRTASPKTYANSLKILAKLQIDDLENQINQFVGQKSLDISKSDEESVLFLLKETNWGSLNEKGEKVWREVVENVANKKEVRAKLKKFLSLKENRFPFLKELNKIVLSKNDQEGGNK